MPSADETISAYRRVLSNFSEYLYAPVCLIDAEEKILWSNSAWGRERRGITSPGISDWLPEGKLLDSCSRSDKVLVANSCASASVTPQAETSIALEFGKSQTQGTLNIYLLPAEKKPVRLLVVSKHRRTH